MNPSTQQLIQQAGAVTVAVVLLLSLAVVVLRLAALALDKGAELTPCVIILAHAARR